MGYPTSRYELNTTHAIPARSSVAVPLSPAQKLTVINTHGTQVVDFWAFELPDEVLRDTSELTTYLSMSHTRAALLTLSPVAPCTLVTNKRSPILKFLSDTSGQIHDTLIPACDGERYKQLNAPGHANCSDNLRQALASDLGAEIYVLPAAFKTGPAPDPLNLFMNIPVQLLQSPLHESNTTAGASLSFQPTVSGKGGKVVFEALIHCVVVMSCCPQDLVPINHRGPVDCEFVVEE